MGLREAVASGHREARFTGTAHVPNFYRESAGPGWALAGDAGHHKDPCTGMGISDAFLAADPLADAIHQALAGHQPADQPSRYQQRRDVLTANGFELTLGTDLAAGTAGGGLIADWKAGIIRGLRGRRGAG